MSRGVRELQDRIEKLMRAVVTSHACPDVQYGKARFTVQEAYQLGRQNVQYGKARFTVQEAYQLGRQNVQQQVAAAYQDFLDTTDLDAFRDALTRAGVGEPAEEDTPPVYQTQTGRLLTEDDIDVLVQEAEDGYDVDELLPREPGTPE